MAVIRTLNSTYEPAPYSTEADLEDSIRLLQSELFGERRLYLDVKRKIGAKGGLRNIPDGYLLDLSGQKPRLFVVENELAAHDPLRHIAVQILQFSLSFEDEPRKVRRIVFDTIAQDDAARRGCEAFVAERPMVRNLDHLLDIAVLESPFAALVVIDEMPGNLERVLLNRFKFGVEVLVLERYRDGDGQYAYKFEPFLADVESDIGPADQATTARPIDTAELDTVVVPARPRGFEEVFLGENQWRAVRIHGSMRPQIKYVAAYRVAPISAITHIAPVDEIEPWEPVPGKMVLKFAEPATEIGPVRLRPGGRVKQLQNLRYTTRAKLESAETLDDVW